LEWLFNQSGSNRKWISFDLEALPVGRFCFFAVLHIEDKNLTNCAEEIGMPRKWKEETSENFYSLKHLM
jgi:hypothetical protein